MKFTPEFFESLPFVLPEKSAFTMEEYLRTGVHVPTLLDMKQRRFFSASNTPTRTRFDSSLITSTRDIISSLVFNTNDLDLNTAYPIELDQAVVTYEWVPDSFGQMVPLYDSYYTFHLKKTEEEGLTLTQRFGVGFDPQHFQGIRNVGIERKIIRGREIWYPFISTDNNLLLQGLFDGQPYAHVPTEFIKIGNSFQAYNGNQYCGEVEEMKMLQAGIELRTTKNDDAVALDYLDGVSHFRFEMDRRLDPNYITNLQDLESFSRTNLDFNFIPFLDN